MSRPLVVLGAPTSAGSYAPGQEAAPRVLRDLGLIARLRRTGRDVHDAGDTPTQVWAPDVAHPRAQNLPAVVEAAQAVDREVSSALSDGADVLVIGGNCTVALGVVSALTRNDSEPGLLYIDRHFDLNTPESTTDGAFDWMGLAHALDLPGTAESLTVAFGRRPLLTPTQLHYLGIDPAMATSWERQQVEQLRLRWTSHTDLGDMPAAATVRALDLLPRGPLAVHVDVDVLDFTDAPLAESTDGRNTGPTLDQLTVALTEACRDPRFRVLSVGELNPARAAGSPDVLPRFLRALEMALSVDRAE